MLVSKRMTQPVVTVKPGDDFQRAIAIMEQKQLRRLPVVDGDRVAGIIVERDLLLAALRYLQSKVEVGELMTRKVVTASPGMDLRDAARLMLAHRVGGLPVVEDGKLVGMITESDIFRRFVEITGKQ